MDGLNEIRDWLCGNNILGSGGSLDPFPTFKFSKIKNKQAKFHHNTNTHIKTHLCKDLNSILTISILDPECSFP